MPMKSRIMRIIAVVVWLFYCISQGFCAIQSHSSPTSIGSQLQRSILKSTLAVPLSYGLSSLSKANAADQFPQNKKSILPISEELPLGRDAYTTLGTVPMCRLLNGMWQVSGAHGYEPNRDNVVAEMARCVDAGYTTFDLADIYGPAEGFVGDFCYGSRSSSVAKYAQFFTKWVPRPEEITRAMATEAINRSLYRMRTDSIDLLQFHWWDYKNKHYYDAVDHLIEFQEQGKIKNLGLTNFDTEHMADLISEGMPVVSNQISFSLIDTRPLQKMVPYSKVHNVQLLCYGTLLGGFLSENWLRKSEPKYDSLTNVSLRKYLPWINIWGGWGLFQDLLTVLDTIAKKHSVSISNVATRWVLDQPTVGGVIIGVRFGLRQHLADNKRVFSFKLDEEDMATIEVVRGKGKDLMTSFGDCGGEYRRRA
eukprot:gene10348-21587_t